MKDRYQMVIVLDDDRSLLSGLERLLLAHGYDVRLHATAEDFFQAGMPEVSACLLLDNQLDGGTTGVEVHEELQRRGWNLPTIFLTAHWNVAAVVKAMREGADDYLTKPFDPADLVAVLKRSFQRSQAMRRDADQAAAARALCAKLTPRERDVVRLVVKGMINKEIAAKLGLALVTVKVHRGHAMRKLDAGNPAELTRIATLAGLVK